MPGVLKLYEPQSFLFIERYVGTLYTMRAGSALWVAVAALLLLFMGMPLRRLSAALLLGGSAWVVAGILAMAQHANFVVATGIATVLAAALGAGVPRLGHALFAAIFIALLARGGGAFVDSEVAFYALCGGAGLGFLFGLIAWYSTPAFISALIGAFTLSFVLSLPFGGDGALVLRIGLCIVLTLFGLWAQFRIDEITWGRVKERWQRMKKRTRKVEKV